ncbi:MAG: HAD-superfamily hydrolase, subfamily variant 3 [Bryobacterales bacterium]|nr:HAD-superfamily hydrolase, subfamily variant 3 [Bryobacterales bacterium]
MGISHFPVYLFDVDGTLVDSALDICGAIQGVLASTPRNDVPDEVVRGYIGRHLFDLWQDVFPGCSVERMNEMLAEYRTSYLARKHSGTRVYPSTVETLAQLTGRKSTATTKGTETTRAVLELFGLLPFFDHVQGTDGFPAKPAPDVIFKSLEVFEVSPSDCLFVGDSTADMEAARRAGVKSCAVTYGYGNREEMSRWEPDYWIDDLRELLGEKRYPEQRLTSKFKENLPMSVAEVANDLARLCREGKNLEAIDRYYSADIVSQESASVPGMPAEMKGIEAIRGKNQWWLENHEVHNAEANGPYVGNDQFALEFKYDVTQKGSGQRFQMNEMALYTVKDGKIVHEHFFYNMGA